MDKNDIGKVFTDLSQSLRPFIEEMRKISAQFSDYLDEAEEFLDHWEDEGGAVPEDDDGLFECHHCGEKIPEDERYFTSKDQSRFYHIGCWSPGAFTHYDSEGLVCCNECGMRIFGQGSYFHNPRTCYAPWEDA